MNLLAGNDVRTKLVSIEPAASTTRRDLVLPTQDALFTSGTLGRYSAKLAEVHESHRKSPAEAAAD
jgi:NADH-quinone oxidoreductase subunit G